MSGKKTKDYDFSFRSSSQIIQRNQKKTIKNETIDRIVSKDTNIVFKISFKTTY